MSQALAKTPLASAEGLETVHTLLCRREAGAFQRAAASGEALLVACTQESRLFLALAEQILAAQSPDGSWYQNDHTTVIALWLLLELQNS